MKNSIKLLIIFCLLKSNLSFAQTYFETKYLQNGTFVFSDTIQLPLSSFFTLHKSQFGLTTNDEMIKDHIILKEDNQFHAKYIQQHKGYPIENVHMNVNGQNGYVLNVSGNILKNVNLSNVNNYTNEQALTIAKSFIPSSLFSWETVPSVLEYDEYDLITRQTPVPVGQLIYVRKIGDFTNINDAYVLAWKFSIQSIIPYETSDVYINANNGILIYKKNTSNAYTFSNSGSGWSLYNGWMYNLGTFRCTACTRWKLRSNKGIYTNYVFTDQSSLIQYKDCYDNNNNWVETTHKTAASAHWCGERAWDYYLNKHGRWASNYNGKELYVLTDANIHTAGGVAGYNLNSPIPNVDNIAIRNDNTNVPMPSANNSGVGFSAATVDIIGHEYNHAMIKFSSNLDNYGEAGAIGEGLCDIFGLMIERSANGGGIDWSIGEAEGNVRYFNDPSQDFINGQTNPSPSVYASTHWMISPYNSANPPTGGNTDPTIHNNSGVIRKWFQLLAQGGTHNSITVPALGIDKAEEIAYISFNWWFWSNIGFYDAAKQSISAAVFHYGYCSAEHKAVVKAWQSVGVYLPSPVCFLTASNINGAPVLNASNIGSPRYSLDPTGSADVTNITWLIPNGWNANITENNELILESINDAGPKLLSVTYEINGEEYMAEKWVRFSNEEVVGDNHMPDGTTGSKAEITVPLNEHSIIYPNPVNDIVNISLPKSNSTFEYELSDINGRIIMNEMVQGNQHKINVGDLKNGFYIIKLKTENNISSHKLIIQH